MKYYTPEDVAEKYRVTSATVRRWIRDQKLKAVKLGGIKLLRISQEALDEFEQRFLQEN